MLHDGYDMMKRHLKEIDSAFLGLTSELWLIDMRKRQLDEWKKLVDHYEFIGG
jgi:hypothetical protein